MLGIDTGVATFGWAVAKSGQGVTALGALTSGIEDGEGVNASRMRRMRAQAELVVDAARGCDRLVVEQLSFPPSISGAVSCSMSWGCALGVAAALSPRPALCAITPQRWQRLVSHPAVGVRRVNYDRLYADAEAFIVERCSREVAGALLALPSSRRTHAIDAACLALVGLLCPSECEEIWS